MPLKLFFYILVCHRRAHVVSRTNRSYAQSCRLGVVVDLYFVRVCLVGLSGGDNATWLYARTLSRRVGIPGNLTAYLQLDLALRQWSAGKRPTVQNIKPEMHKDGLCSSARCTDNRRPCADVSCTGRRSDTKHSMPYTEQHGAILTVSYISRSKFPPPTEAAPRRLRPPITTEEAARWTDRSMLSGSPNTDGCGKHSQQ